MSLVAERSAGVAPAAVAALAEASIEDDDHGQAEDRIDPGFARTRRPRPRRSGPSAARTTPTTGEAANAALAAIRQEAAPEPTPPAKAAAEPAKDRPETWPAGAMVRRTSRRPPRRGGGRRGRAAARQREAHGLRRPGPAGRHVSLQHLPGTGHAAASLRQDRRPGAILAARRPSPADRIAVVCERMLLWEVTRKEVPDANDFVITLPAPGELRIHAEIPEKPAKQEYWIVGRPPGRVDWESDSVFYRGIEVPNPGERVAPATAARSIRRRTHQLHADGHSNQPDEPYASGGCSWSSPGKRTDATYDRKTGRAVEGRVRGLEKVKLRYACVTIGYLGPGRTFQARRQAVPDDDDFDVIPITSDGRFTTPPLPPNQYEFRLTGHACLDACGRRKSLRLPGSGEGGGYPRRARPSRWRSSPRRRKLLPPLAEPKPPIPKSPGWSCMPATNPAPRSRTSRPSSTLRKTPRTKRRWGPTALAIMAGNEVKSWNHGDLIVSAAGFASTIEEIGPIEGLRKVDVTLKRGKKVRLRVRDAAGKPISPDVMPLPQVYLPRHRSDAWSAVAIKDTDDARPDHRGDQLPQRPPRGRR